VKNIKYFSQYIIIVHLFLINSPAAFSHGGGGTGSTYYENKISKPVMAKSPELTEAQSIDFLEKGLNVMRTIARENGKESVNNIEILMEWDEADKNMQLSLDALKHYIEKGYGYAKKDNLELLDAFSQSLVRFKLFLYEKNSQEIEKEMINTENVFRDFSKRMGF